MTIDLFTGKPTTASLIPARDPNAVTGSQFIQNNMSLTGTPRKVNILNEFLSGNIPDFLRNFCEVKVSAGSNTISYFVMPDVLSIGSDSDYCRMPMTPLDAQKIVDKYDCTLSTRKMVNDTWKAATYKLEPIAHGPPYDLTMLSTDRFNWSNTMIENQLQKNNIAPGSFISGIKKDIVLSNALAPNNPNKRVCIFGWLHTSGQPIQQLNPVSHESLYLDYSHSSRMVCNDVIVNGQLMRMQDVFADHTLSSLISDEGPLTFTRY